MSTGGGQQEKAKGGKYVAAESGQDEEKKAGGKKLPLSLFSQATSEKNVTSLAALKRHDSEIEEILASATHSTVYIFDNGSWLRASIEGPLFIAKRKVKPFLSLIILNRLSPENLNEDIDTHFEVQVIDRYLIFRNAMDTEQKIRGLWFHSLEEHQFIATFLQDCIQQTRQAPQTPPRRPMAQPRISPATATKNGLLTPELLGGTSSITKRRAETLSQNGNTTSIHALDPALVKQAVLSILDDPLVMERFRQKYAQLQQQQAAAAAAAAANNHHPSPHK